MVKKSGLMKKICFVMGGAELQSWLIANELSENFDVHFIVKK